MCYTLNNIQDRRIYVFSSSLSLCESLLDLIAQQLRRAKPTSDHLNQFDIGPLLAQVYQNRLSTEDGLKNIPDSIDLLTYLEEARFDFGVDMELSHDMYLDVIEESLRRFNNFIIEGQYQDFSDWLEKNVLST